MEVRVEALRVHVKAGSDGVVDVAIETIAFAIVLVRPKVLVGDIGEGRLARDGTNRLRRFHVVNAPVVLIVGAAKEHPELVVVAKPPTTAVTIQSRPASARLESA